MVALKSSKSNNRSTVVTLRLPNEVVARIDALAERVNQTRGEYLRDLIVSEYPVDDEDPQ